MTELRFFNPYIEIRHTANRLPHWQQHGAVYFVTFRLADAVPAHLRLQLDDERATWLRLHPEPWNHPTEREYHKRFSGAVERWLDAGHGSCLLRRRECAEAVSAALQYFDGSRVAMIAAVVMPNHVHALFVQNAEWPLEKLLYTWKTFTAKRINSVVDRRGTLWQRDYFDRLVRDQKHFENCVRYIRLNPKKARLSESDFLLYESEIARSIE